MENACLFLTTLLPLAAAQKALNKPNYPSALLVVEFEVKQKQSAALCLHHP